MVLLLNGFAGSYAGWLKTFPFCNAAVYSEKDTFVKNVETKKTMVQIVNIVFWKQNTITNFFFNNE